MMEKLRSFFSGQYPYRCYDCQTRFYAYRTRHRDTESAENGSADHADHKEENDLKQD